MMSQKYQTEQQELDERIENLETELATEKETVDNAKKWIALIKQFSIPTELTAELLNNSESFESYYDSIEICEASSDCNFKYAIVARNRDMIDRSDMVVVYVKNESGGAYQTLKYAEKNQKRIINLYHTQNEN